MSFDWRTEDEHGWDAPDLVSSSPNEQKPEGKRRWLRWLIPLGLLLVALMVVGWTINKRVRTATAQVELDVVASHALVEQAIARQDVDLFQSVLSGRDSEWTAGMMRLVAAGDLMERDGLGLIRLPVTEPITPTVEVSADLLEAEVMTVLPYAIEVGNGLTETVFLAQTAVYRRGTNRWLLASPDAAYWGDIGRIKSQYVTLSYPERDKEIALDLLLSLDAKIGQVCTQLPDIDCPDNYQVSVALSTDPDSFRQLSLHAAADNAQKRHLILPTPTLAGLPLDQAGKSALLRGYGQLATTAILTDLWGYDCCKDTSVLYFALLRDTLRQLGLMPWPGVVGDSVSPSQYDHLFKNGLPQLFSGASFWYQMEDGTLTMPDMRADMLTAFAREELGLTAPELVISLNMMRSSQSFGEWLQDAIFNRLSARELENAWLGFVYDHSSLAQQMPPVPLPDQDIQLLCHIGSEERMAFYRYQLTDDSTQLEQSLNREVNVMVALPNDDGLAVWEAGFNNDATSMFFWVDDKRIEISWDAGGDAPGSVPMKMDPSQSKLILAPAYEGQVKYGLLDVSGCLHDACALETMDGYPVWSPDLAHTLLLSTADFRAHMAQARGELMLADGVGEVLKVVGSGSSPFWLNNETYAFVMDAGEGRRNTVLSGKVGEDGTEVVLTVADLTAGTSDIYLRLIDFVAVHPELPHHLIVVTMDVQSDDETFDWFKEGQPGATLFVYDLEAQETVLMAPFAEDVAFNRSYRFSPNGRFLLFGEGAEYRPTRLHLLDLATGDSKLLRLHTKYIDSIEWYTDFSLDGNWLLVMDNDFLHLLYPGSDYEKLIIPSTAQCETAVWVNP